MPSVMRAQTRTLREVVDRHAERTPDAAFLLAPEPSIDISFRQLRDDALALTAFLDRSGVARGGVVSYMLPNGISAATILLATMYAGRIVSPLNLVAQDSHLAYTLAHSTTQLVFTAPEFVERIERLAAMSGRSISVRPTDPDAPDFGVPDFGLPSGAALPVLEESTPALLMYTSGTTGVPKGALLSHGNIVHAGEAIVAAHQLTEADRVLSSLPLYHINGQCIGTISPLIAGGSIVLPHRFSVSQWWSLVERYRPTWINMVPTIISYLLNGPELTAIQRQACASIRFGRSASSALPPEQHRAFEARFGISVIEAMGLTECASVAFANPLDPAARKYGSAGRPVGCEARVVGPDRALLDVGESGEIELRGGNVMLGYFNAPELTAQAISPDGWLSTGDLGRCDEDGFYFITGRLKELIIKGGENIAPREIDEALLRHPAVLEAAAVGIADPHYGQDILACVVLKADAICGEDDLRAHCLAELGRFKSPRLFRFVAELPKGPSGKVQRLKLLDAL